jgi:hypothetical protein
MAQTQTRSVKDKMDAQIILQIWKLALSATTEESSNRASDIAWRILKSSNLTVSDARGIRAVVLAEMRPLA